MSDSNSNIPSLSTMVHIISSLEFYSDNRDDKLILYIMKVILASTKEVYLSKVEGNHTSEEYHNSRDKNFFKKALN